jgi:shikimate dehydrogenase
LKALEDAGVAIDGKKILMLGAGGAARAIAFNLAMERTPDRLTLLDINEPLLNGLALDLRSGTDAKVDTDLLNDTSVGIKVKDADIIINCTPIGMHPKEGVSLVQKELFRPEQTVFDVVYTPLETRLLSDASAKGAKSVSGVEMFINQAVLQFKEFTGVDAPQAVMRRVVMERLRG